MSDFFSCTFPHFFFSQELGGKGRSNSPTPKSGVRHPAGPNNRLAHSRAVQSVNANEGKHSLAAGILDGVRIVKPNKTRQYRLVRYIVYFFRRLAGKTRLDPGRKI